jgi:AraC family transcriptional activator of mtrCDE
MDALAWVTLHFVLRGSGQLHVAGAGSHELGPHHLAIVPEQRGHTIQAGDAAGRERGTDHGGADASGLLRFVAGTDGDQRLLVACGRLHALYAGQLGLFDLLDQPMVLDFSRTPEMRRVFGRLLAESAEPSAASGTMMKALMNECLVLLFRELCADPQCKLPWLLALENPRLHRVIEEVLRRPGAAHRVGSLADLAGMSRSAFAREFHDSFGQTPMAFVRHVRLRCAADLLRSSTLTVSAIAHRVGFSSRSHFSGAFTEYFDRSPSDFRSSQPA